MTDASVPIMTLVVRVERGVPPQRTDALEAAAAASVAAWLATESNSAALGESARLVARWQDGPRKIVRRARALMWRQAAELADTRVVVGSAEVLGFKVHEVGDTPEFLRSMQVSGLELDDHDEPGEAHDERPVIWLNPHLAMTTGKAMAQAGHGAVLAWEHAIEPARAQWTASGFPVSVRMAPHHRWSSLSEQCLLVTDEGYTELTPGSVTAAVALPHSFVADRAPEYELALANAHGAGGW